MITELGPLQADLAPEEREAQVRLEREHPAQAVERLLRREKQAVLSTLSLHKHGWPFASLAPYALSRKGEPILLLSTLAQHTKNLRADSRCCLFIQDPESSDPQAGARLTLLGRVQSVPSGDVADARARYLARHEEAEAYFAAHDFGLYQLAIDEARYIGGFGIIGWIPGTDIVRDPSRDPIAAAAAAICAHMNEDHAAALSLLCDAFRDKKGEARMVAVDGFGFDVEVWKGARVERLRFDFESPVATAAQVREAIIALVAAARGKLDA